MGGPEATPGPAPRTTALALYVLVVIAYALTAGEAIFRGHTDANHFALLAEAWLRGQLDLGGPPPEYTGYNDFAVYQGKFYVSFPPLPATLLAPLVALSGGADRVRDGLFFLGVSAATPSVLFLALERLRDVGLSVRTWRENVVLSLCLAFGTVYWFSAVQGTVWYAAHGVGALLAAGYLWASAGATYPLVAGLCLGLGFATRTPLLFAAPFFALELVRVRGWSSRELARPLLRFAAPALLIAAMLAWHNAARFGDPLEFGHRHLDVVWRPRIERWGLFSLHYLGRNLGVLLAGMPYLGPAEAPFRVSAHGLALWITSPFYVWALWPRAMPAAPRAAFRALALTSALVLAPSLLYQNTGWIQFGYRFSNDVAVFLFAMIAVGRRRLGAPFSALAAAAVAVNLFGALSFQRPGWERYYVFERKAHIVFEAD